MDERTGTSPGDGPLAGDGSGGGESTEPAAAAAVSGVDSELARLADLPLAEHPDVYEGIHAQLRRALVDVDDA